MKKLSFLLAMLLSTSAFAQLGPKQANVDLGAVLNGQDLQAARGFNVLFPKMEGWGLSTLFFKVTDANDSVTAVTMKCYSLAKDEPMLYTGITRANCSTDTITLQANGRSYALVENTDWLRGATDATATTALANAINAIAGGPFKATIGGGGAANSISVVASGATYSMWVYTSDATCAVANPGLLRSSLQDGPTALGVFTSYDASWSASNAANQPLNPAGASGQKQWPWRADVENLREMKCVVTPTGGAAADLIYVDIRLATKGS